MSTPTMSPKYSSVKYANLDSGRLVLLQQGDTFSYCLSVKSTFGKADPALLVLQDDYMLVRSEIDAHVLVLDDPWRFRLKKPRVDQFAVTPTELVPGKIAISTVGGAFTTGRPGVVANLTTFHAEYLRMESCFYVDWLIETRADETEGWNTFFDPAHTDFQKA